MSHIWFPYTQMKTMSPPIHITHADGVYLYSDDHPPLIDAISSWWCMIHGYNHPELNAAITDQLNEMAHVMLGGLTHTSAEKLAEKLVAISPAGMNHVFFSDSGSVGMEVAIKLALQFWKNKGYEDKRRFVALKRAYHGDTCGVISIGDPDDGMHASFAGVLKDTIFLDAPTSGYPADRNRLNEEIQAVRAIIDAHHTHIAAVVVEPLMQGAGGFNVYSPDYLNALGRLCKTYDILFIFDEVATGFGRTGTLFAADQCDIIPDIITLGKGLTAGYIGHAATLVNDRVYTAFLDESDSRAFFHGPTFMGNPLACAVALKSIELFERYDYLKKIKHIEEILKNELESIVSQHVRDIRVLGAMGVIECTHLKNHKNVQDIALRNGVWLRPFGNYIYTMPPYIINDTELLKVTRAMNECIRS